MPDQPAHSAVLGRAGPERKLADNDPLNRVGPIGLDNILEVARVVMTPLTMIGKLAIEAFCSKQER